MPAHLRFQSSSWATHHVVSRCIQGYGFLKPTQQIRKITRGVFSYSVDQFSDRIQIHHFVFLSNHFHLLISAESSQALAEFMCHFKGNLARELGRIHDWHGSFWKKRYSSEEFLDEAGLTEVFKYITQNSVKEGLVDHPRQWIGLHGYHQLVMGKKLIGPWINRTAYFHAIQRRENVTLKDYTRDYKLKLTPPPMWSHLSNIDYKSLCKKLCYEAIQEAQSLCKAQAMGMAKVLKERVRVERFTKRSIRPLYRTKCIKILKAYQTLYFTFKAQFQEASAKLRQAIYRGEDQLCICFPVGGVPLFGGRHHLD
jgi:REP element-mobilizing transposase RayT